MATGRLRSRQHSRPRSRGVIIRVLARGGTGHARSTKQRIEEQEADQCTPHAAGGSTSGRCANQLIQLHMPVWLAQRQGR